MIAHPSRKTYWFRHLLPGVLLVGGAWLLTGCFFIPLPKSPDRQGQPDVDRLLGDSGSRKPIEPFVATKGQVLRLLGSPVRQSPDGRVLGYQLRYRGGAWVLPLCFYAFRTGSDVAIRLEFDAEGILTRYQIEEDATPQSFGGQLESPSSKITDFLNDIGRGPPAPLPPPTSFSPPPVQPRPVGPRNDSPDGQRYDTERP